MLSSRGIPYPGIKPTSLMSPVLAGRFFTTSATWEAQNNIGGGLVAVVSDSCDPIDDGLPGFSVHGILQARILEWVASTFSRGSSQPRVSCITGSFFTK